MAITPFGDLSALWAIASGAAVAALGIYSLRGGKSRPRGALPFGLFALAWGTQITTINLARLVSSPQWAESLYIASLVGLFFLPYFLIEFAASQVNRRGRTPLWYGLRATFATLAITASAVFALAPDLLFRGVSVAEQLAYPDWGSLFVPLVSVPVFVAFGLALHALATGGGRGETERVEQLDVFFLVGIGLYVGYASVYHLVQWTQWADVSLSPLSLPTFDTFLYLVTFASLSLFVVGLGYRNFIRWRTEVGPESERAKWVTLSLFVPFASGIAVRSFAAYNGEGGLNLVGFWRLLGVGIITYGFARRRLYDLPQRTRRAGATASGSAGALAAGGTAFGVGTALSGGLALPLVAGAAVAGATAMPALKWARRVFGVGDEDNPVDEAEQLYEQKIETYRAALEDAMARGTLEEDEGFLAGLRERFGVSEEEDRILRYYARKATVPRREDDPDTAYERLRILGEGGAGRTWLARDRSRDRLVVLKEPLEKWHNEPAVLQAARREAELAAKVRHPNVVEVEEVLEDEGRPVLVMEYVTGGSLADKLRAEGTLSSREAVKLGFDLAQGLEAIHEAGIVHRDLTPDNVLIAEDGRAMIADFGLARNQDGSSTQLLEDEAGTRGYQAPEAARGSDAPAVDVYGLAAILHTCLYGSPPVEGTVQVEADVPRELQAVIETGLLPDPDDRYRDARTFADALEEVVHA